MFLISLVPHSVESEFGRTQYGWMVDYFKGVLLIGESNGLQDVRTNEKVTGARLS